jgi:SPP1 family predicted phage head-tail adaptor
MIGRMRERVTIQAANRTADSVGQRIPYWYAVDTVSARCRHLTGAELERARAIHQDVRVSMTVRYRKAWVVPDNPAIDPDLSQPIGKLRALWNGVPYNIHAALPDERRVYMDLLTSVAV